MAGDWIPYYVDTSRKPEVLVIARTTGRSRHEVLGLLMDFWGWVQSVAHQRLLERLTLSDVCEAVGGDDAFWLATQDAGWVVFGESGVEVPNAEHWLEKGANARLLKTKRQQRYRANKASVDAGVDGAVDARPSTSASTTVENSTDKKSKPKKAFTPPSRQEISEFAREYEESQRAEGRTWPIQDFDAAAFLDHYTANGWKQGNGNSIKDWKATVRNWGRRNFGNAKPEQLEAYQDLTPSLRDGKAVPA